ncbi:MULTISPECIES: ABC transporter ATP-binding protein [Agrobacterium]|jgi:branched-chain amino acid transport system ATP-binding protein|uniref:Putative branched-chain amino acid transport protein (ATP binding protein) livG-like protein n=1 Tax=Agrobacterium tumefaciens str. Kerr 14 TaxID=1183424 RepID=A0A1S7RCS3_AGRTU|nr:MULTISPECIES: ABC transporter ATP-binding protein [Agrobacterium]AYM84665.1 branched-chain amino acid transport system ATP-binding protein [Agrobacterium tumefaciens]KAA1232852.1 ABC transporter ATP-binding protein [Agrobacterium tumefaciens]MBB4407967.1 branched-chain amino acid transport system ATP-binding protein [Agrobacterium radiobacter]MBB4453338.1 branched-chain amino acid transport system ATP-binding protein [Agrobacterium radiobacter]MBP2536020.1 branched-chain amino acid transpor
MSAVLEITDIRKTFGGLKAVDGLGLTIEAGEVVGLLGPNGSGKTTLMNLVSGALKPTEGSIRLKGQEIAGRRPDVIARAGVARTFQLVRLLPSLSLLENVAVSAMFGPQRLSRIEAEKVARACLERIGLAGRETMPAGDLTYIDQKRLELARALAGEPKLLLLDEWLAGLNPTELQEGIALIRRLASEGTTILLVEHIMAAVHALCPRSVVMAAGRKIADGPTATVLDDPQVISAYLGAAHA